MAEGGVNDYVEYGVKHKVYPNLCGEGCRDLVSAWWNRHIAGEISFETAIDEIVKAWPPADGGR